MSDPIQSNTPSAAIPPSPATESAPNSFQHAPEPVQAPPAVIAPPSDTNPYRINTLENGQQEVVLDSGQTYRGTPEQVINELAKAQFHASRRITELGQQVNQPPPPQQQFNEPQIDPTAKALADYVAQGEGFVDAADKMRAYAEIRDFQAQQQLNNVAAQFMASTPDFQPSEENGNRLDAALQEAGMTATVRNLQIMHTYLKSTGQYVVSAAPQQQVRQPGMPMPPNGQAAPPNVEKDIWSMNQQEFADYENRLRQRTN